MITKPIIRFYRFKKCLPRAVFYALFSIILVGCTDSRYLSEKLFWQAEQKTAKILKGKDSRLTDSDYEEIISVYRKVKEASPLEPLAAKSQFIISQIYLAQGRYDDAQKELKAVIQNFSSRPTIAAQAQFALGGILETQGKWKGAAEEYDKITDLYPMSSLGLKMPIYLLQHYRKAKKTEEEEKAYLKAMRGYNALLKEYADTRIAPLIKDHLALLHFYKGNFKKAIETWGEIIENYSQSPLAMKALLAQGEIYDKNLNDKAKARQAYGEFIKRYPQEKMSGKVKLKLGELYFENSDIDKAKEVFSSLLADDKNEERIAIKAHLGLAYCYAKEADTANLLREYELIKNNYPRSPEALAVPFLTAEYYLRIKLDSPADRALKKAIVEYREIVGDEKRSESERQQAANFLTLSYLRKKNFDEALEMLETLTQKYPQDPIYLMDIAAVYTNLNALDKAINVYKDLIAKYPRNKFIINFAQTQIKSLKEKLSDE